MLYDLAIPAQLTAALLPDLLLMGGAMCLMLLAAWKRDSAHHQRTVGYASLGLLTAVFGTVAWMALRHDATNTGGVIAVDGFRFLVDLVVLLGAAGTIALAIEHNDRDGITQAESHVLVLFAASGMMILAAARDLMVVFLGIEIMSVAVYVLAGLDRRSPRSAEASLKYFLLGAFATGFLLYGMALIYGATGETQLNRIGNAVGSLQLAKDPMFLVGCGLLLVGLGFKVAAAPFHMWAPDVYDGAPTPITAFMAASVKAAAFAAFLRIWFEGFYFGWAGWANATWWLAVVTMVVGNVVALQQKNIKRMLAYSSIVHSGYLLVAVTAASAFASTAFTFYVLAYTLATFGAFAVVATMQPAGTTDARIADYEGLWHVRPWLATAMGVYLLALLGFPVFGGIGFFAKWYLVQAALASPSRLSALAVILVVTSVISAGYYLQVVRAMFMQPRPADAPAPPAAGVLTRTVMVVTAALILALGLFPSQLVAITKDNGFRPYPFSPALQMGLPQMDPLANK
ncbi:MAG: NADH-quinone oxidoreductase subunit N [Gemmatimonadaceae bacterium]|nr:NADH-quinone oxidoreductase subunit N [Gemmatimonadaceae bacterium]